VGYASTSQFTYDLGAIMRRLGQEYHSPGRETSTAWRIGYATKLIDKHDFPVPLPYAGDDPTAVHKRSRWTIPSVDKWFEDRDPDGTTAADAKDARAAADTMDARAVEMGLRLVGGTAS
jgi:hypothetical protein